MGPVVHSGGQSSTLKYTPQEKSRPRGQASAVPGHLCSDSFYLLAAYNDQVTPLPLEAQARVLAPGVPRVLHCRLPGRGPTTRPPKNVRESIQNIEQRFVFSLPNTALPASNPVGKMGCGKEPATAIGITARCWPSNHVWPFCARCPMCRHELRGEAPTLRSQRLPHHMLQTLKLSRMPVFPET